MTDQRAIETYQYKAGQRIHLDDIYDIMGLAGGRWWVRDNPDDDLCEKLRVVEDITIEIIVTRRPNTSVTGGAERTESDE